jgi:hypothetical protein
MAAGSTGSTALPEAEDRCPAPAEAGAPVWGDAMMVVLVGLFFLALRAL